MGQDDGKGKWLSAEYLMPILVCVGLLANAVAEYADIEVAGAVQTEQIEQIQQDLGELELEHDDDVRQIWEAMRQEMLGGALAEPSPQPDR